MPEIGQPAYQQLADSLRARIASEELPVGSPIPSTAQLTRQHGVSITVVRAAINQLRAEGLVVGQPGKAVYVRATPESVARERVHLEELAAQVEELREGLKNLGGGAESSLVKELLAEVADLRRQLGIFHTQLIDLYGRMGQPYPHEQMVTPERDMAAGGQRTTAADTSG